MILSCVSAIANTSLKVCPDSIDRVHRQSEGSLLAVAVLEGAVQRDDARRAHGRVAALLHERDVHAVQVVPDLQSAREARSVGSEGQTEQQRA